jgi:hypothetical protein
MLKRFGAMSEKVGDKLLFPFGAGRRKEVDDWDKTIIAFSPFVLKDLCVSQDADLPEASEIEHESYKIRLASDDDRANSASLLVQKMYATRGYPANPLKRGAMRFGLMAYQNERIVGTVTLNLDSEEGLLGDQLYKQEIDLMRREGKKICELTKLAIDRGTASKHVFAGLLHIAYIYSGMIYKYTDLVLEVVPRHVDYYIKVLGCEPFGPERLNPRVNAPVRMLRLSGAYVQDMINRYGGKGKSADTRTLYAYFFSQDEAEGIMGRLLRGE